MIRNDHAARPLPRRNAPASAPAPARRVASAETTDEPTSPDDPEVTPT
ncbi:hypothetical protein [Salarchaeum japonicum]|nr:hypothetical protein [Salarchaeum japonicum]